MNMKICFVASKIVPPWDDGLKNAIIDLSVELAQLGADVTIVTSAYYSRMPKDGENFYGNIKIFAYPYYLPENVFGSSISGASQVGLNVLYHIPKLNKQYNFDIIHSHSGAPLFSLLGAIPKKMLKIPAIHTLHGLTNSKVGASKSSEKILTMFDRVIVTTKNQYEMIKSVVSDSIVMPDGINIDKFYPLSKKEREEMYGKLNINPPIIGFIGPLTERKGFHNFLSISRYLIDDVPDIKFLVMNSTPYELIQKQIEDIKDYFIFTGYVKDRNKIINCMDIVVFPFDYINITCGQPIALLESMACNRAVIATMVEGIDEIIIHNENGLLCPRYDTETLRKQIVELIENEEKRKKIGVSAMVTANKYNIKDVAKQTYSIYEEVLQKRG